MRIHNYFNNPITVHDTPSVLHDGDLFISGAGDIFLVGPHDDGGVRFVKLVPDQRRANRPDDHAPTGVRDNDNGSRSRHPSNTGNFASDRFRAWPIGTVTPLHPDGGTDPDAGPGAETAGS